MDKILVTGGSGLLGGKLMDLLSINPNVNVFVTYNAHQITSDNCESFYLDIKNKTDVSRLIARISPDIIIHTAAFTNVDRCETQRKEAYDVNVEGTRNIISSSKDINPKIIYVSTDYVFDGERGMYKEDDPANPIIMSKKKIIDSLIGSGAKIFERNKLPKGHKFVIGDNSEVEI